MSRNPEENPEGVVWDKKCPRCGRGVGQTQNECEQLSTYCDTCADIIRIAQKSKEASREHDREFLKSIGILPT